MTYIRPTLNLLTPAVRAIRSDGTDNDIGRCVGLPRGEKGAIGADGVFANSCNLVHTSTTSAYEVDE
jgi:hypothetical protein